MTSTSDCTTDALLVDQICLSELNATDVELANNFAGEIFDGFRFEALCSSYAYALLSTAPATQQVCQHRRTLCVFLFWMWSFVTWHKCSALWLLFSFYLRVRRDSMTCSVVATWVVLMAGTSVLLAQPQCGLLAAPFYSGCKRRQWFATRWPKLAGVLISAPPWCRSSYCYVPLL